MRGKEAAIFTITFFTLGVGLGALAEILLRSLLR